VEDFELAESAEMQDRVAHVQTTLDSASFPFGGGLVFKAHRPVYHSTLVFRVMKKKKRHAS
jgi:hypothetical protein